MKKIFAIQMILMVFFVSVLKADENDEIFRYVIPGDALSGEIVTLFFDEYTKAGMAGELVFEVPAGSVQHVGGVTATDTILFGRTGRPLNGQELASNKKDIFLGELPLSIIIGKAVKVETITLEQLLGIFSQEITSWEEIGGGDHSILTVGLAKDAPVLNELSRYYPLFVGYDYGKRFDKEAALSSFFKTSRSDYAIGFGVAANYAEDTLLDVAGFSAGIRVGLVFDLKNRQDPVVKSVIDFAESKKWQDICRKNGVRPVEKAYLH